MQILAPVAQLRKDILAHVLFSFNYQALRLKGNNLDNRKNSIKYPKNSLKTPNTKKVSNFFIERDQSSSSILSYSLPPRSSSYISYISNFLAFSLSPLQPTSLSSRNYSRQEEISLKKSYYNNSYMYLFLDSKTTFNF